MPDLNKIFTFDLKDFTYYNLSNNISKSSEYGGNTLNYIGQGKLYATCFQQLINYLRILKNLKKTDLVLDVGCGQAEILTMMRENFFPNQYVGIEIMDANIKKAMKKFRKPERERLLRHDISIGLPLKDETVDLVTCNLVLEHLPKEKSFFLFSELVRVCKPEGKIIIMMPIRKNGDKNAQPKHVYEWTMEDIDEQIKKNNVVGTDIFLAACKIKDIVNSSYKEIYKKLKHKVHPIFIRMVFAPLLDKGTDIFLCLQKERI